MSTYLKHTIFGILILLSYTCNGQSDVGYLFLKPNVMDYDDQQHALGGIGLGFTSYIYFETSKDKYGNLINTEMQAYLKSSAFVLGVSLLKESNDKWLGKREFDVGDIGSAMFGHFVGATTAYLIRKRVKKRAKKKAEERALELKKIDRIYEDF